MTRTGIARMVSAAAVASMAIFAAGSMMPAHAAHAAATPQLSITVSPDIVCPTATASNGKIAQKTGKPAFYFPKSLTGTIATSSVASVCEKNVTKATQVMTGPSCSNFSVPAGTTIAISASAAGTYACGLKGSRSVLTVTIS